MLTSYAQCGGLQQHQIDYLKAEGVSVMPSMVRPYPILCVQGIASPRPRRCIERDGGPDWFAFVEDGDIICWRPETGQLVTMLGRAFALGQDMISLAGTYALGRSLAIFADPLEWLRNERKGIVIVDWSQAFDLLRDCPRISLPEDLLKTYHRHMKPSRLPAVSVRHHGGGQA